MIPYGKQEITKEDEDAVLQVLRSDFLTQGPMVPRFEHAVVRVSGAAHAVALNSATSALHVACAALGLGAGDWLWTSPVSFVASANCGLYCGAKVDFVDIDPVSYNMCPDALAHKLEWAAREGRLPKVLVPVHLAGQSCDMERIHALTRRYGIKIIEDASHAIGGRYQGEPIGNCRYSEVTIFSFHPVKIITSGEGGMALTNDPELAWKMALLRSHGITRDPGHMTHAPDGPWYYQQIELGFNYRMTEIQAALGLSQLGRLTSYVERRHLLARRYNKLLEGVPLQCPYQSPRSHSAFHLYVIRLQLGCGKSHLEVFKSLHRDGIGVNLHYIPIHLQPYYRNLGFGPGDFPQAEAYYAQAISLPIYAALTDAQQDEVVAAVRRAVCQ
jgi:UDP-4-amino-4,6-dideoxy-N-acetyl-beta-L-altrosamine transaminase